MELIIDINENDYEMMKNGYVPHSFNMFYAIKNGIPLDKIRTEIADLDAKYEFAGYYKAVNDAIQIIDKYR